MENDLQRKVKTGVGSSEKDSSVMSAINLYDKARNVRRSEGIEDGWEILTDSFMDQFDVKNKDANDFTVSSKILQQAHNKFIKQYDRPARKFISDSVDKLQLEVVRDAVDTVQKRGGLKETLSSSWGLNHKFALLGTGILMLGKGTSEDSPVKFSNASLMDTYIDPFATETVTGSGENAIKELLIVQEFSYDEAQIQAEKNDWNLEFTKGKLPLSQSKYEENNMSYEQQSEQEEAITQFGHYYNIKAEKPVYTIFAGSTGKVIKKYEGDLYPFITASGDPFIPAIDFKMFPVPRGFYGRGLHLIYDLSVVDEKLRNLALAQVKDNVNPISIVTVAGKSGTFLNQAFKARELRKIGEKGWIVNEINANGQNTASGTVSTLQTQALTSEYERIKNDIITEIKRCNYPLDDNDIPVSQKATNTVAQTSAIKEFIREVQLQNEKAYRLLDLYTMAIMVDNAQGSEASILTNVQLENGEVNGEDVNEADKVNIGDAVEVIQSNSIDVMLNISEAAQIERILPGLVGTKAFAKFQAMLYRLEGLNISEEDLMPIEQGGGEGQISPQEQGGGSSLSQIKELTQ